MKVSNPISHLFLNINLMYIEQSIYSSNFVPEKIQFKVIQSVKWYVSFYRSHSFLNKLNNSNLSFEL